MTGIMVVGEPSNYPFGNDTDAVGPTRITKIVVNHGEILDALTITYWTPRGDDVKHYGGAGGDAATISLSSKESVVGVYGQVGFQSTVYGKTSITQLQFSIQDSVTGLVRVEGPFATKFNGESFAVSKPVNVFAGYLTDNQNYIQALCF